MSVNIFCILLSLVSLARWELLWLNMLKCTNILTCGEVKAGPKYVNTLDKFPYMINLEQLVNYSMKMKNRKRGWLIYEGRGKGLVQRAPIWLSSHHDWATPMLGIAVFAMHHDEEGGLHAWHARALFVLWLILALPTLEISRCKGN